jgi:hypothetical protein
VSELVLFAYVHVRVAAASGMRRLLHDERGEGVISAAIAVLVMAFLGALMWVAFKEVFAGTTAKTKTQVDLIGS